MKMINNMLSRLMLAAVFGAILMVPARLSADSITSIMGTGIGDDGWTTTTDLGAGIKLGLRFRERDTNVTTNNGLGLYQMPTGYAAAPGRSAVQMEWSIWSDLNGPTGGLVDLTKYKFELKLDTDISLAQSWMVVDPITFFGAPGNNSYGWTTTANGAGVEDGMPAGKTVAQNSWNTLFFPGFDPTVAAILDMELRADSLDPFYYPSPLSQVKVRGIIGNPGGSSVPDSASTAALMGLGLVGLGAASRRIKSKDLGSAFTGSTAA